MKELLANQEWVVFGVFFDVALTCTTGCCRVESGEESWDGLGSSPPLTLVVTERVPLLFVGLRNRQLETAVIRPVTEGVV